MGYLYYSLLFAFLYVYSGFGLTLLFCPKGLRRHVLFLSPMVGYCYVTLLGWLCYNLNLRGTDLYGPALLFPPFVFLWYALANRRHRTAEYGLFNVELIAPLAIGIIAFIVISLPFIVNADSLTSMSLGNADIAAYSSTSRYLKEFAPAEAVRFLGDKTSEFRYVPYIYFGPCLATALPSSLFSLETYELQNISLHTFFLFSILLFYSLAREVFRYNHYSAIVITALYGLSPITYYTAYQGFQGQIIAIGLAMCLILLNAKAIDNSQRIADYYSYIPLVVLFTWGMLVTYRHMLPLLYVPLAGYVLLTGLYAKSRAAVSNWVLFLLMTVAMTSILSPFRVTSLVTYVLFQGYISVGWHSPLLAPDAVFGLTFDDVYLRSNVNLARVILSTPLVAVIVAGFVNAYRKDRRLFLIAASSVLPILLGYIVLAFRDQTGSGWGGYRSYKFLSFFLPQVLLGSLILFRNMQFAPKRRISYLLPLSLGVLLGCSILSCYAMVKNMSKTHSFVSKDLADLKRVESDPRVESVNILRADFWETLWRANFLMRKQLYFETTTYYYYTARGLDGQWDLKLVTGPREDIIHLTGFEEGNKDDGSETIVVNSTYVLQRVAAVGTFQARFEKGWYDSELTHRWTGASSDEARIILECAKDKLAIDLRTKYWPLDRNNRLSIYLNGSKITDCPNNDSCQAKGMILSAGQNVLTFKTALPPTIPSNADQRHLGYAFTSIDMSPSESAALVHTASSPGK